MYEKTKISKEFVKTKNLCIIYSSRLNILHIEQKYFAGAQKICISFARIFDIIQYVRVFNMQKKRMAQKENGD
ncbi:hypothetical protein JOC78_001433 [Bacillus ectoiniformans]|uniref:hypothetical protein n=1 Tax=Bacillus ectoiniformans TaxID=1494429 RepID=UPI00195B640C|nr:hypothetical protein [Bacillus ectoiniformans]MBM7648487.1 hypothetical protein [Bacillus ectoiniformans]